MLIASQRVLNQKFFNFDIADWFNPKGRLSDMDSPLLYNLLNQEYARSINCLSAFLISS